MAYGLATLLQLTAVFHLEKRGSVDLTCQGLPRHTSISIAIAAKHLQRFFGREIAVL